MKTFLRSIRFRLTVWFVAALAVIMLVVTALLYLGLRQGLLNGLENTLRQAAELSVQKPAEGSSGSDADLMRALTLIRNAPARLLSLEGAVLQSDAFFPHTDPLTPAVLTAANRGEALFEARGNFMIYTAPVRVNQRRVAIVQTAASLDSVDAALSTLRNLLFVLAPIALGLAALGGLFFAGQALAPAERIRRDVERIEATDLSRRVGGSLNNDEIGKLAQTFDGMLERVEGALARERRFTSDASHELRSPLTVIKAEISAALARPRTVEYYQRTLTELDALSDELNAVVEDLLTLARTTNNSLKQEPIDLSALCVRIGARMRAVAVNKGLTLALDGDAGPGLIVHGDALRLQRAISNLLDNAIRYTEHGEITLSLDTQPGRAIITVRDTGIGIDSQHLPHLFERFYRAAPDRGRDSGGTGLGLSIVEAIVEAHGGEMNVTSTLGVGSAFSFWVPCGQQLRAKT